MQLGTCKYARQQPGRLSQPYGPSSRQRFAMVSAGTQTALRSSEPGCLLCFFVLPRPP